MLSLLRPALVVFLALTLVTGVAYPLAIMGIAQVAFPGKANGSLVSGADGRPVGSRLIGQEFGTSDAAAAPALAKWFWGRP
ncbi:MAG: potassium-transporting ATPase subunit C [Phycisphaerales bacterium]|nr:potassium-transporting ATPase subunit C [Phycisphaerales bacterium]